MMETGMGSNAALITRLSEAHPSLKRGMVWCRHCKRGPVRVNSADCLQTGWPKCCGYTMTIDSPEEQKAMETEGD